MTKINKEQKIKSFIQENQKLNKDEQLLAAERVIEEISEVDVDVALYAVQKRISTKGKLLKIYTVASRFAAILILPLIVFSVWTYMNRQPVIRAEKLTEQTITCPLGMRSQVNLPDGSLVWLNAGSTIKYSVPFINETRKVELEGEAFFDVVKNEKSPFSVRSKKIRVNVLGTKFNFKSYSEDKDVEVALTEGSVDLSILSGSAEISNTEMKPGDHFSFNRNSSEAKIKNHDLSNLIGWKNNKLIFDDTPILEMEKILERWYGVEIEVADEGIESYKFTTTFENLPLEQVLQLLELSSPIKMAYIPAKFDKKSNQLIPPKVRISKKN